MAKHPPQIVSFQSKKACSHKKTNQIPQPTYFWGMLLKPIICHLLFWFLIMGLGIATIYPYYQDLGIAIIDRAIFLPVWWIGTYLNWWVLMPKWLAKGQLRTYIGLLALLILLLTIIQRYLCLYWFYPNYLWENPPNPADLHPFLPAKFIQFGAFIALPILSAIGVRLLMNWYQESYQAKQIIAQQQAAELTYLKAQINPHFLFNTLNNLYGLSLEESKKVPGLILKLSDILSYSLYESSADRISLYKEVKLIEDFITLEQERYGNRMNVEFIKAEELDETIEIAPLLLIPLVENAFKHGVKEATEAIPIRIYLGQSEQSLVFEVNNQVPDSPPVVRLAKQGLGLKNLERRLELLYPRQHSLTAERRGDLFFAKLKLEYDV